jgi:quinol monooxygenase YgiN
MYGTVAHCTIRAGHHAEVRAILDEWGTDRKPHYAGAIASYSYQLDSDPQHLVIVAVFADRGSYAAQADDPEQGKWYGRLREHLDADPQWNDGEIISSA